MNNTINNSRLTRSNPSFGSFSQEARKFINKDAIEKLAQNGKILLSDVDYLAKHKLEIDVRTAEFRDGKGLVIVNPYNAEDFGKGTFDYKDRILTPHADKWLSKPFEGIGETLHIALKKAVRIAKKFDKFEKRKEDFLAQNCEKMTHLDVLKSDYTGMMKAETQLIIKGESKQTKENMDLLAQHLNSATKSLSVFEKKEEKLDAKIRSVFAWWRG